MDFWLIVNSGGGGVCVWGGVSKILSKLTYLPALYGPADVLVAEEHMRWMLCYGSCTRTVTLSPSAVVPSPLTAVLAAGGSQAT